MIILLGVGRSKLLIEKIIIINTMMKIKILIIGFISIPLKPRLVFRYNTIYYLQFVSTVVSGYNTAILN